MIRAPLFALLLALAACSALAPAFDCMANPNATCQDDKENRR